MARSAAEVSELFALAGERGVFLMKTPGGALRRMRPVLTNEVGSARINALRTDVPIAVPQALASSLTSEGEFNP